MLYNLTPPASLRNHRYVTRFKGIASYMKIPQNTLFSMALEEFIERHNGQMITEKINEAYKKIDQSEFIHCQNVGLESTRNLTKNDTW